MALAAGRLRHRVTIQSPVVEQDSNGSPVTNWVDTWVNVPAAIEPLSAREFIAAQAAQSEVKARIVIRWRPGLSATQRILHNGKIYNPAGWLPDPESGREYVTAPVSEGVNQG